MASTPSSTNLRPPVVSTEVLTDEQCQRILALRVAREVLETKQTSSNAFASGGLDVKEPLLLLVAEWVVSGDIRPMVQLQQELDTS